MQTKRNAIKIPKGKRGGVNQNQDHSSYGGRRRILGRSTRFPGCFTQGDTWGKLLQNVYEAIEACLSVEIEDVKLKPEDKVLEIAV